MENIKDIEGRMQKSVDNLKEEYVTIRAGRANPHILDRLRLIIMEHLLHFSRWLISLFQKQEWFRFSLGKQALLRILRKQFLYQI